MGASATSSAVVASPAPKTTTNLPSGHALSRLHRTEQELATLRRTSSQLEETVREHEETIRGHRATIEELQQSREGATEGVQLSGGNSGTAKRSSANETRSLLRQPPSIPSARGSANT